MRLSRNILLATAAATIACGAPVTPVLADQFVPGATSNKKPSSVFYEKSFERTIANDVAAGRLTTQQAKELLDDYTNLKNRLEVHAGTAFPDTVKHLDDMVDKMGSSIEGFRDTQAAATDRAESLLTTVNSILTAVKTVNYDLRPILDDAVGGVAVIFQRRAAFIADNPTTSPSDKKTIVQQTIKITQGIASVQSRLDVQVMKIRDLQQKLDENHDAYRDKIATIIEKNTALYGPDIANWPTTPPPASRPASQGKTPPVAPGNDSPASGPTSPDAPPDTAPPDTRPDTSPPSRPSVHVGTVPPADPYQGLRVPQYQGGTGPNPAGYRPPSPPPSPPPATAAGAAAGTALGQQAASLPSPAPAPDPVILTPVTGNDGMILGPPMRPTSPKPVGPYDQRPGESIDAYWDRLQTFPDAIRQRIINGYVKKSQTADLDLDADTAATLAALGQYAEQTPDDPLGDPTAMSLVDPIRLSPEAEQGVSGGTWSATDAMASAGAAGSATATQSYDHADPFTVADLLPIYAGYNIDNAPPGSSLRGPSSAGIPGPSSAPISNAFNFYLPGFGMSPSQLAADRPLNNFIAQGLAGAGTVSLTGLSLTSDPVRSNGTSGPVPGSLGAAYASLDVPNPWTFAGTSLGYASPWTTGPLADTAHDLAEALYGPLWSDRRYLVQSDPTGRFGRFSTPYIAGSLFTDDDRYLAALVANDIGGLNRLLAQPFNVLLTWGAGAFDLDLHLTGPLGATTSDRFHIYYAAQGNLTAQPFAQLIKDCICASGSEVILTSALNQGGVYRILVFNFGDQSAASSNLANASNAIIQIVRGGTAVSQGNGTTIVGGRTLLTVRPPSSTAGNTWVAAEIDPRTGRIATPGTIVQTVGDGNVR